MFLICFESDDVLDHHCDARSLIKRYEIPCQKLYEAENNRPNKQMFPTRIKIIKGVTSKYPLQESRSFLGASSASTNIYKYAVVL